MCRYGRVSVDGCRAKDSLTRSEVPARVTAETALSKTAGPGEVLLPGTATGQRSAHMEFLSLLRPRVNTLVDISR